MTITLQEVNELIWSLESVGELSIREQKFLKLAKSLKQLVAENVALKKSAPAPFSKLMMEALDTYHSKADDVPELAMLSAYVKLRDGLKIPVTDRIVDEMKAEGRAEGINFAASRLAAAFNHGFVDKPVAEVRDVVRMILDAKADLANSPRPAEDGLSGEYAEKSLAEWEVETSEVTDK